MNELAGFRLFFTCEHASPRVPPEVDLGLSTELLHSHISYDRGAAELAFALATSTGASLLVGEWSRLVVDLNRRHDNPNVISDHTYGIAVPGNARLDEIARRARIARWHTPFRATVDHEVGLRVTHGGCMHVSVHSFEPDVDPQHRTFDAGVLFDPSRGPEARAADSLCQFLHDRGLDVRENEPYAGFPEGTTSWLRERYPADRYIGLEFEASYRWDDRNDIATLATELAAGLRSLVG